MTEFHRLKNSTELAAEILTSRLDDTHDGEESKSLMSQHVTSLKTTPYSSDRTKTNNNMYLWSLQNA